MFLKPSAIAAGCMVALVSFDAGAFRPRFSRRNRTIVHHASGGRVRTRVASRPLGRLPAQLGRVATLFFSANPLGSSPRLPLVDHSRLALEIPALRGVFYASGTPSIEVSRGSPANLFSGSTTRAIRTYMSSE